MVKGLNRDQSGKRERSVGCHLLRKRSGKRPKRLAEVHGLRHQWNKLAKVSVWGDDDQEARNFAGEANQSGAPAASGQNYASCRGDRKCVCP